jgi:NAD(P)-dependent dehydrogenase (short-subunit alcohol dehydrogenase family)
LFQNAVATFQSVDILINNAGIGIFGSVEEMAPQGFKAVLETNLLGVYHCCHEAIPLMKQRGGGYIFNISSLAGVNAHARMAAYNASKFGLNGFSEALMQEVRHVGSSQLYLWFRQYEFGGDSPDDES